VEGRDKRDKKGKNLSLPSSLSVFLSVGSVVNLSLPSSLSVFLSVGSVVNLSSLGRNF